MSEAFSTIRVEIVRPGVARLVLARPDKHNALNPVMLTEITAAAEALGRDEGVRVVVLAGEGRSFCAGGDLQWMREQAGQDRAARLAQAGLLARMLATLDGLPKLTVAEVAGPAYGGGVGIVAVCDIAVAAEDAVFALTETRLGVIAATIGPFVVGRVGPSYARRVMLNARRFSATEALGMGLVSAAVPLATLRDAVDHEVELALQCAPGALAATKAMLRRLAAGEAFDSAATASLLADRWETAEAGAGLAAFFARSRPPWWPDDAA